MLKAPDIFRGFFVTIQLSCTSVTIAPFVAPPPPTPSLAKEGECCSPPILGGAGGGKVHPKCCEQQRPDYSLQERPSRSSKREN